MTDDLRSGTSRSARRRIPLAAPNGDGLIALEDGRNRDEAPTFLRAVMRLVHGAIEDAGGWLVSEVIGRGLARGTAEL
jgi:hypothetical protein